jgi:hypothetical protein
MRRKSRRKGKILYKCVGLEERYMAKEGGRMKIFGDGETER